jgi:hypothetical protein
VKRALCRAGLVVALVAPLGACYPKEFDQGNPLGGLMRIFILLSGGNPWQQPNPQKNTKVTFEVPLVITGSVGGLDGTYNLDLNGYGTFSGTASVKRQRFVTLKVADSQEVRSAVDAALTEVMGANVSIGKAKGKLKAFQTPGGVKVKFSGTISFEGNVDDGPNAPRTFRGTLKIRGEHPSAD